MPKFRLIYFNQEHGEDVSYTVQSFGVHQCDSILSMFTDRYLDVNGEGKLYPNQKGYYPIVNARLVELAS